MMKIALVLCSVAIAGMPLGSVAEGTSDRSLSIVPHSAISQLLPTPAIAQLDRQAIAEKAKQVTVVINGQNPGSGAIVGKQGNNYIVLTAKHVVATTDEYEIVTPDGVVHPIDYNQVRKFADVDLALVQFTSNQTYAIAEIGDSDRAREGANIYIAGWPHPGSAITERIFQITDGQISGRSLASPDAGYELVYTNITRSGMSGGPVFDDSGRAIGVHGRAEGQAIYNPDTGDTVDVKSGFNLGIPIATFIKGATATELSSNPSFAYPLTNWADRFLRDNNIGEAIATYEKAIAIDGNFIKAQFGLGQAQYQSGDKTAAIARFQQALNLIQGQLATEQTNPQSPTTAQLQQAELQSLQIDAQLAWATALYGSGDRQKGLSLVLELLKAYSYAAGQKLAQPDFASDRLRTDIQPLSSTLQKLIAAQLEYLPVELNLAQSLSELGEIQQAISYLETLLQQDSENAQVKLALASALNANGDRARSESLVSALRSQYGGEFADEIVEFLLQPLWSDRLRSSASDLLNQYQTSTIDAQLDSAIATTLVHSATDTENAYIEFLAIARDGKTLVSTNGEGGINIWDLDKGSIRHSLTWTGNLRDAIAMSPDGGLLAIGVWESAAQIKIWDTRSGELLQTLTHPGMSGISALAFSPDGQTLASSAEEIILWNVSRGQAIETLPGNKPFPSVSLAFSPDGNRLASSSVEIIQLWNVTSGELVNAIEVSGEHIVSNLLFNPNGNILISHSGNDRIRFWNPSSTEAIATVDVGGKYALSPDGQTLAVCSGRNLTLVNVGSAQVSRAIELSSTCVPFLFAPDGKTLVSGNDSGKIELWDFNRLSTLPDRRS